MSDPKEWTPEDLIREVYPNVREQLLALETLIKVNPQLTMHILQLAVVIGIDAAHWRLATDERFSVVQAVKRYMYSWDGFK